MAWWQFWEWFMPKTKPLRVFCPPAQTAISSDGSAVRVLYPPATTIGGKSPVTLTYSQPSGNFFAVGVTLVLVTAKSKDGQMATCTFTVTVVPAPLTLACPPNQNAVSPNGQPVAVTYPPATTTGGKQPVTITYSHPPGSLFPVGTTIVTVTATEAP